MNIWGFSGDDIYVCGHDGVFAHYDGSTWSGSSLGDYEFAGIWGTSGNDLWMSGQPYYSGGALMHNDGDTWTSYHHVETSESLNDCWDTDSGDIAYAVGGRGAVLKKTDGRWLNESLREDQWFRAVWGSGADDVYAVGDGGAAVHYDGGAWNTIDIGTQAGLYDIWGSSASDVYVAGTEGVWHYDGSGWGNTTSLLFARGVWGASDESVFASGLDASGSRGLVLRGDGSGWDETLSRPDTAFTVIAGFGEDEVYVGGYGLLAGDDEALVLKYDAGSWTDVSPPGVFSIVALGGNTQMGLFAAGTIVEDGFIIRNVVLRYNGDEWSRVVTRIKVRFNGIWGTSGSGIYLVGNGGAIVRLVE
jgi:hypothetical protein